MYYEIHVLLKIFSALVALTRVSELWGNRSDDILHDGCGKPCTFTSHWKWILYAMRVFSSNWKWTRISSMCPELFSIDGDILSSLLVLMPTLLSASSRALGPWFQRVLSTIFKKIERRSLQRWEHQFVPSLYTSLPFGVCAHIFRKRLFDDLGDAHSRPLKISSRAAFSCMDHPLGHERERESGFHHRWERLVPEGILQLGRKRMFLDRQNGIKTGMLRPVTAFHFIGFLINISILNLLHSKWTNFKI